MGTSLSGKIHAASTMPRTSIFLKAGVQPASRLAAQGGEMKTSTILYAALALEAGVLGCQNENAAPRREQPVAGFAGGKDLPTAANDPAPSPSIIGVNTMHA